MKISDLDRTIAKAFTVVIGKVITRDRLRGITITPAHARRVTDAAAVSTAKIFGTSPEEVKRIFHSVETPSAPQDPRR